MNTRCGICNTIIEDNENWTETDCVICEACNERCSDEEEPHNEPDYK